MYKESLFQEYNVKSDIKIDMLLEKIPCDCSILPLHFYWHYIISAHLI